MSPTTAVRRATVVLATLGVLLAGAGCSEQQVRDAASDAAGDAACSVARSTMDEVAGQAQGVVDRIGADPAAARRELEALRDTARSAEEGLSGQTRRRVAEVTGALDALADEAGAATDGTPVDRDAVAREQDRLDDAVAGLRDAC